jgi:hypothetical protein
LGSYPEKGAFSKIVSVLKRKVTAVSALVIPCYFLYTSQTIVPEQLKNIDDMLFRMLVKEGFPVALVPVQLSTTTDYQGSYSSGERELLIRDFPFRVYQQNSVTEETTSKILKTVPSGFKFTMCSQVWKRHICSIPHATVNSRGTKLNSEKISIFAVQ